MGTLLQVNTELNLYSVLLRLLLAVTMGGLIGMERETKSRPAGFRTYMLVSLGATVAMILNQYLDFMQTGPWAQFINHTSRTDVSRLGAQVINGVGFLGAGTILVTNRLEIKGITTAAGLWTSACLGLSIGAGFYACAVAGVVLILVCMGAFSGLENRIMANARNMSVYIEISSYGDISHITSEIRALGMTIFNVDVSKTSNTSGKTPATLELYLPAREPHETVLMKISAIKGIRVVSET